MLFEIKSQKCFFNWSVGNKKGKLSKKFIR
jgi:hypothetical protein